MDDRLNQAVACRHKRALLFAIATCVGMEAYADQAWHAQNASTSTALDAPARVQQASRTPQFVHEPEEMQTLPWETVVPAAVAKASIGTPINPPVPAKIPRSTIAESSVQGPAVLNDVSTSSAIITIPAATSQKPMSAMLAATQRRNAERNGLVVDFASLEVIEDRSDFMSPSVHWEETQSAIVMPGISIAALRQSAATSLDEANNRLMHRASLSAAAAATRALALISQSIDLSRGDGTTSKQLDAALTAIREAGDFVGRYGLVDAAAISRMVQSHETKTLKGFNTSQLTGIIAADVYLDSSRQMLSEIASADPMAAHALCLLAKAYRQQTVDSPIALATSVHLMRAAVSAAPKDRELAVEFASVLQQANMVDEARMQQAYIAQLPPTKTASSAFASEGIIAVVTGTTAGNRAGQPEQAVRIEQISPEVFAMVSKAEAGPTRPANAPTANSVSDSAGRDAAEATEPQDSNKSEGNVVSRAFKTMTRIWR